MITALPKMVFGWFYPFNDDEAFAELQAEELCDKLNGKR